jgi:hypothetical protein
MYSVIAAAGETLIGLLRENMNDLISPESITLLSPADVQGQNIRLTLFLYNILENPHLKNQGMPDVDPSKYKYPPLVCDLYYLLTTYASSQIPDLTERTLEEHRILGRAMSIFYDNSILSGSIMRGSLSGSEEELRVTLNSLSLDDLNRIWTSFPNCSYRPSVSYLVTPAVIDSKRESTISRVLARDLRYYTPGA